VCAATCRRVTQAIASCPHSGQNGRRSPPKKITGGPHGYQHFVQAPGRQDASGYLTNAERGNAPGVVVIHEWWGLSEQIKGLCDRFALAGFDAAGARSL